MKKEVQFGHFSTKNGSTVPALDKPEYRPSRLWYTSVAYVNAGSRVRITALSGLTHVRISGRALYMKIMHNFVSLGHFSFLSLPSTKNIPPEKNIS